MQSEGGAAGAVHGALQSGSLSTTFTASQGLLLMIPNMYKIAGELTSTVFHVSARTLATHALSIYGDHSDVMGTRQTGFALIASRSPQEAQDMALIATASTLESRIPFLHFFDGFRTSHEVNKIFLVDEDEMRAMIDDNLVRAHKERALSPDHPVLRGSAQNPDVFFQERETCTPFYNACPAIVQKAMDKFAKITGRQYHLFDYAGPADAEHIVIMMGSGAETTEETASSFAEKGEKVGVITVHLVRPFSAADLLKNLAHHHQSHHGDGPHQGTGGNDPLYLDVVTALNEALADGTAPFKSMPRIYSGRYGLGSKDYTPAMAKAVFDNAKLAKPRTPFCGRH